MTIEAESFATTWFVKRQIVTELPVGETVYPAPESKSNRYTRTVRVLSPDQIQVDFFNAEGKCISSKALTKGEINTHHIEILTSKGKARLSWRPK